MLVVGLLLLARKDAENRLLGKHLCFVSAATLGVGTLFYYVLFTPMFGLD